MPVRKVNLKSVRAVLPRDGSPVAVERLASLLGVDPKSVRTTLPKAMWECCGVKMARGPRGQVIGIQRWDVREGEWSEPMRMDLQGE